MTMPFRVFAVFASNRWVGVWKRASKAQIRARFSSSAGLESMLAGKVALAFATLANVSVFTEPDSVRAGPSVEVPTLLL